MDELIARIASLIRRYTRFNQQAGAIQKLNFDGLQIDLENRSVTTSNGTFELPPKEFDLLLYCAKHQGKILTIFEIETEEIYSADYSGCFPVSNPADLSDDNALYDVAIYGSGRCFRWTI